MGRRLFFLHTCSRSSFESLALLISFAKMSQVRVFSLIGDSNVRRHITKTTCRASPAVKSAQIIPCGALGIFAESLKSVRADSNVVIISCLTNFLTSADGTSAVSQRVDPVLQDIRDVLFEVCGSNPSRHFVVSPPMYRTSPVWYREGLPEVLSLFSQSLGSEKPDNLHILSSFATPEFESDGVHLTIYSALQFILHLFDSAQELLDGLESSPTKATARNSESTRVLEDRVMVLEQDHRRLNRVVEHKIAVDSEIADFRENERHEDCFVVAGLPAIDSDLAGKAWQDQAVKNVQEVIVILMGKEMPILYVKNSTKRYKDAEITYTVRMQELSDAKAIRRKSGSFFLGGTDKRPKNLKKISFKNFVTPDTNTRISLMKLLAQKYRSANKGAKVQVIGYDPRPMMKITPPASAEDRRIKTYNFVEAVTKLPNTLTDSEVEPLLRRINPDKLGKIRSIFIILSDDAFRKLVKDNRPSRSVRASAQSEVEEVESTEATGASGSEQAPGNSRKRVASTSEESAAKK